MLGEYQNVDLIQADAKALPFPDGSFDYAICLGATFGNFSGYKIPILNEIVRVLRDDGNVILSIYSDSALPIRLDAYNKIGLKTVDISEEGTVVFDKAQGDIISEQFTEKRLIGILENAGLSIIALERAGDIAFICKASKKRKGSGLGETSGHYTTEKYISAVEQTKDRDLQYYMEIEKEAITGGVNDAPSKTFVDIGAGYGRVLPAISAIARNVVAIELNEDMFRELKARANAQGNSTAIFGDALDLGAILSSCDVRRPVLLLLQNTLAVFNNQSRLLAEMSRFAREKKGEIIISLFKQEALERTGVPMYATLQGMVGEPDFEKINYKEGIFASKTGYVSKWWKPEEREEIVRALGGSVVKTYEGYNFWILHVSFAD